MTQVDLAAAESGVLRIDSVAVSYSIFGSGAASSECPLLFVHGGGASSAWWHPIVAALAPRHRIAALDLSGHGRSGWRREYSYRAWAEEIAAVADTVFPRGCVLVGHSLGGALAFFVAAARLLEPPLVVSFDGNPAGPPPMHRPRALAPPRRYATRAEAVSVFAARKPSWPSWLARCVGEDSVAMAPEGWRMRSDPRTMSVPVDPIALHTEGPGRRVLVVGENSPFAARDLAAVSRARDTGRVDLAAHVVAGVGHELIMEDPDECAAILHRLLSEIPTR